MPTTCAWCGDDIDGEPLVDTQLTHYLHGVRLTTWCGEACFFADKVALAAVDAAA